MKKIVIEAILILAFPVIAHAAVPPLSFRSIDNHVGLPSDIVFSICEDRQGFMWFFTEEGVCRYDGYDIEPLNRDADSLSYGKNVNTSLSHPDGTIWIGTTDGLYILEPSTFSIRRLGGGELTNQFITCLRADREGNVWIGTENGLNKYIYGEGRFVSFRYGRGDKNGTPGNYITEIYEDSRGNIWVSCWETGFVVLVKETQQFIHYPEIGSRNTVASFLEDSEGNVWLGTWGNGLYLLENPFDPAGCRYVPVRHDGLEHNIIASLLQDKVYGAVWIGTTRGLYLMEDTSRPEQLTFYNYRPNSTRNPSNEEVRLIYHDKAGECIWLASHGGGVDKIPLRQNRFERYSLQQIRNSFMSNTVTAIHGIDGNTLLGIKGVGLVLFDREKRQVTHYRDVPGLNRLSERSNTVYCFLSPEGSDEIWMGTRFWGYTVFRYDRGRFRYVREISPADNPTLASRTVLCMTQDRSGNIWIGTENGLNVIPAGRPDSDMLNLSASGDRYSVAPDKITAIIQSADSAVWIASEHNGIYKVYYDSDRIEAPIFRQYSTKNGNIGWDNVQAVLEDSAGNIWAASAGKGLLLYDPDADMFVRNKEFADMHVDIIYSLLEDNRGMLWAGTNKGLYSYDLHEEEYRRLTRYDHTDGLQDNIFIRGAAYRGSDGELFFGGYKGFNIFNPGDFTRNTHIPPLAITKIKISNREVYGPSATDPRIIAFDADGSVGSLTLSHKHYNLAVSYSALSYVSPDKNMYMHKLVGLDRDWQIGSDRTAHYSNLKPGNYTLLIKGSNDTGLWNEESLVLSVVVLPAWYVTWWAWTLYVLGALAVLAVIVFNISHRIKASGNLRIERLEREKLEEINDLKLRFFTNISHEFLTPLSIISCSVDDLGKSNPQDLFQHKIMRNNISRLMRLLEQVLEFRKSETGNLRLKVSQGDIMYFIQQICTESFLPLIDRKRVAFSIDCSPRHLICWFDTDKLDKVLYNLLSNAFKYSGEGNAIRVTATGMLKENESEYRSVRITVADSGRGIAPDALKDLFKRFYEGDYRRHRTKGNGIGLSLTKDLVELHNGTIEVESEQGKGTVFTVTIPVCRDAFKPEQIDDRPDLPENGANAAIAPPDADGVEKTNGEKPRNTILLAEDDPEMLGIMKSILSKEYDILTASDGNRAFTLAVAYNPDIVVSDVMMPEMDGYELSGRLKENLDTCHIPVILLTAKIDTEDQVAGLGSGADAYLTKPFNFRILEAQIRSLLDNRKRITDKFRRSTTLAAVDMKYSTLDEKFLAKAIAVVEEHIEDPDFDMKIFLDRMHITNSMLYRKLKSLTGLSPNEFVRNIRLKTAYRIITEKYASASVSEIAYALGFNNPKYFTSCFKKEFGMTPTEYMDSLKKNNREDRG